MLEWIASVMIAIEPVITPGASLSTIRREFETIETAAARVLGGGAWAAGPIAPAGAFGHAAERAAHGRSSRQALGQRPRRAAAVADGVLLLRRQLGHRAPVVVVGGHEGRVVAEAAVAAGLVGQLALAAALGGQLAVRRPRRPARTRRPRACRRRAAPRAAAWPGSPRRWRPRRRSAPSARPGAPPSAAASMPESSATAGRPVRRAAARALMSALSANVVAGLGRQLDLVGQQRQLVRGEQRLELAHLVRVACGEDEPHGAVRARRSARAAATAACWASRSSLDAARRRARAARRARRATAACARRWPAPRPARRRRS